MIKLHFDEDGSKISHHSVTMRFPSKHLAHTLLQLGSDRLVTVSEHGFEHWDMQRHKRKPVVSTTYGQILHACKLVDSVSPSTQQ